MTIQEMSIQDRERAISTVLTDDEAAGEIGREIARVLSLQPAVDGATGGPALWWETVYGPKTAAGLARLVAQILLTGD